MTQPRRPRRSRPGIPVWAQLLAAIILVGVVIFGLTAQNFLGFFGIGLVFLLVVMLLVGIVTPTRRR